MCGIVGIAGALTTPDERLFKVLLLLDYFRGQDSTGLVSVSKKGKVQTLKLADDPIMLFNHTDYDSTVVGVSDVIWIGHNRAATVGATTRSNAHPFVCDHIVGVHNGTLEKDSFAEIASRLETDYGTDSETIFQHMAVYGVEDTISRLQGAWALVWYDDKQKTLNMIRNDQRPLFTCEAKKEGKTALIWASEYEMISAAKAMTKSDRKLKADKDGNTYFPLPVDTLHTWSFESLLEGRPAVKTKSLKGRPKAVSPMGFTQNNKESKKDFGLVEDVYEIYDIEESDDKLILGVFDEEEWSELSRFGCGCCGADVSPEEEGLVIYVNEGVIICSDCSEEPTTAIFNALGPDFNTSMLY